MLRSLVALPALLIALVPQPTTTDTPIPPVASPSAVASPGLPVATPPPSVQSGGPMGLPELQTQIPAEVRRHMVDFQQLVDQQHHYRRSLLAALTPAHRALLSRIVGEMAVADEPDFQAAAARVNAALSPTEAQAITDAQATQQIAMMQRFQQIAAMQSQQSPVPQPPPSPTGSAGVNSLHVGGQLVYGSAAVAGSARLSPFGSDAGSILLRATVSIMSVPNIVTNTLMPVLPH